MMWGKKILGEFKLSKKELAALFLCLTIIFSISFFIGGYSAQKKNESVAALNAKSQIGNDEKQRALEKEMKEERKQQIAEQKFYREQKKLYAAEEARKAAEEARKAAEEAKKNANLNNQGDGSKVVYLTFDDGPSTTVTPRVLDTLKNYNVKGTFFVIGNLAERNSSLVLRALSEGNAICNHTYSHNLNKGDGNYIYNSTKIFLDEFSRGEMVLKSLIPDYKCKIIRFPGGSYNREEFKAAAVAAGYHYVDWDIDTYDTKQVLVPAETIYNNVVQQTRGKKYLVILMHDAYAKSTTADALPRIIEYLKSQGYTFKVFQ